jgi:hypothetical protein
MSPASTTSDRKTHATLAAETREPGVDFAETDAQDDGHLPALARRFHITDLQHWLDLCA